MHRLSWADVRPQRASNAAKRRDDRPLTPWLALAFPACAIFGALGIPAAIVAIIDCKTDPRRRGLALAYGSIALGLAVTVLMAVVWHGKFRP